MSYARTTVAVLSMLVFYSALSSVEAGSVQEFDNETTEGCDGCCNPTWDITITVELVTAEGETVDTTNCEVFDDNFNSLDEGELTHVQGTTYSVTFTGLSARPAAATIDVDFKFVNSVQNSYAFE